MSELTPEMLAELKRLEQAATKVEWELFAEAMMLAVMAPGPKCIAGNVLKSDHDPWNYDAQLIAALRNAAPALIAAAEECERLRERVRELEKQVAFRESFKLKPTAD